MNEPEHDDPIPVDVAEPAEPCDSVQLIDPELAKFILPDVFTKEQQRLLERTHLAKAAANLANFVLSLWKCKQCGHEEVRDVVNLAEVKAEIISDVIAHPIPYECMGCAKNRIEAESAKKAKAREERAARKPVHERGRKFAKRNGFTHEEWYRRVDEVGWACTLCGKELTKTTVMRWCPDGSKALDKTVPVCRVCQCKRVGLLARR